ncbi:6449_t:CDS:2 [Acaulospora colombiana]|uniref:6449_t:CDS:1 n=1 Tax=Acaulospora colombiana TaxID=27376 RepID=A0ACA9LPC8_9GLOM|nr:6449_t:CDS:2 [Acaulospora colombiana]
MEFGDVRNRKTRQDSRDYDSSEYDSIDDRSKGKKVKKSLLGISTRDMYYLGGLILVAIFVRAYKLEQPSSVVKYIKGRFFMDVHPPLAKLLITLAGVFGGFDGNFDFKEIGKDYLEPRVPYITMRLLPTIMGIFVIPISYLTIKLAGFSTISAILVSTLLIFEQQITLYPHMDSNNEWLIENVTDPNAPANPYNASGPSWITHYSVIRLNHIATSRRLHSHEVRPSVTDADYHNEVSAYGFEGFGGDANDHWRVEIVESDPSDLESEKRLRTIHSKFRLRHMMTGCYLFSHRVKLPEWGFEQQEVTCIKGGTYPNTVWYIESNQNPDLPEDTEMVNYKKPGFIKKFWELNKVMWNTNKGLTDSHPYESRPTDWVLLNRGISFWSKDHRQIYLIGNPLTWWTSSVAVLLFVVFEAIIILRSKRGYLDHLNAYGSPWIKSECNSMKWVDTWDYDCNNNFDTYEEYKNSLAIKATGTSTEPPMTVDEADVKQDDKIEVEVQGKEEYVETPKSEGQVDGGQVVLDLDAKEAVQVSQVFEVPPISQENTLDISVNSQQDHMDNDALKGQTSDKVENSIQQENVLTTPQSDHEDKVEDELVTPQPDHGGKVEDSVSPENTPVTPQLDNQEAFNIEN